jgi:hypothetical protein
MGTGLRRIECVDNLLVVSVLMLDVGLRRSFSWSCCRSRSVIFPRSSEGSAADDATSEDESLSRGPSWRLSPPAAAPVESKSWRNEVEYSEYGGEGGSRGAEMPGDVEPARGSLSMKDGGGGAVVLTCGRVESDVGHGGRAQVKSRMEAVLGGTMFIQGGFTSKMEVAFGGSMGAVVGKTSRMAQAFGERGVVLIRGDSK